MQTGKRKPFQVQNNKFTNKPKLSAAPVLAPFIYPLSISWHRKIIICLSCSRRERGLPLLHSNHMQRRADLCYKNVWLERRGKCLFHCTVASILSCQLMKKLANLWEGALVWVIPKWHFPYLPFHYILFPSRSLITKCNWGFGAIYYHLQWNTTDLVFGENFFWPIHLKESKHQPPISLKWWNRGRNTRVMMKWALGYLGCILIQSWCCLHLITFLSGNFLSWPLQSKSRRDSLCATQPVFIITVCEIK